MEEKITKLIVLLNRVSAQMQSLSQNFEKISLALQDPEIIAAMGVPTVQTIFQEDYD